MRIVSGSSANVIYFVGFSTADHVSRVSDLGTFDVTYSLNGSTGSTVHNMTVAAANSTKMPGVYKLNMLDSTVTLIPSGMDSAELCLHITSSMDPVTRTVEIFRRSVTTGQTLALNTSGKIADVESILSKASSIEANTTALVVLATSINTNVNSALVKATSADANIALTLTKLTSVESDVDSLLTKLTSVESDVDGVVTKLTSVESDVDIVITKLTSVETDVDAALVKATSADANISLTLAKLTSVETDVNAIQAQTTQFVFTQSGKVDSNVHYINNVQVQGVGTTTDTWRPV